MKYIMFGIYDEENNLLRKVPIIFPSTLIHKDIAKALSKVDGCSSRIVSAGELSIRTKGCHGESTTLGIKSKMGDTAVINTFDYTYGIEGVNTKELNDILDQLFKGKNI